MPIAPQRHQIETAAHRFRHIALQIGISADYRPVCQVKVTVAQNCGQSRSSNNEAGVPVVMQRDHVADHLLFFTRLPQSGGVKSRLAREIGDAHALAVHDAMSLYCLAEAEAAASFVGASLRVLATGASLAQAAGWLGKRHIIIDQGGGDLGIRVERALSSSARQGAKRIVVVGSDCPALTPSLIIAAFGLLTSNQVTLGPATDGGFYLLGIDADMVADLPVLLANLPWGTNRARAKLLQNADYLDTVIGLLPMLGDVDTLADIDAVRWPWLAAAAGVTPQAVGG